MSWKYNAQYPSVDDLQKKAQKRIPRFALKYLVVAAMLKKNTDEIPKIELNLDI